MTTNIEIDKQSLATFFATIEDITGIAKMVDTETSKRILIVLYETFECAEQAASLGRDPIPPAMDMLIKTNNLIGGSAKEKIERVIALYKHI